MFINFLYHFTKL